MLIVNSHITIPESEIDEKFIRASGPGGQNVNKVATGVQLRFNIRSSASLPDNVRERLLTLTANRISADGVLTIEAQRYRTQDQNRQDARRRLVSLIRQAADIPAHRHPTRPTRASVARRVAGKLQRGRTKRLRRTLPDDSY